MRGAVPRVSLAWCTQLLNTANARKSAEQRTTELEEAVTAGTAEAARLFEKAEEARKELHDARAEADEAREQAASARLALDRSQLQHDQDTLALQRQFASSAEEQLERIRVLQQEQSATRDEQAQRRAAHENALARKSEEVKRHDQMRGEINMQLDAHKEQLAALQKHVEILAGLRKPPKAARGSSRPAIESVGGRSGRRRRSVRGGESGARRPERQRRPLQIRAISRDSRLRGRWRHARGTAAASGRGARQE